MGNIQQTHESILSQTQLLRALYIQRMVLTYHLNNFRIRQNYKTVSPEYKHENTCIKFSRFSARKLIQIRQIYSKIPSPTKNFEKLSFMKKIEEFKTKKMLKVVLPGPEAAIEAEVKSLVLLQEHLKKLESLLEERNKEYQAKNERIKENLQKAVKLTKKQSKLADLTHYRSFLKSMNQFLEQKVSIKAKSTASIPKDMPLSVRAIYILLYSKELIVKYKEHFSTLLDKFENEYFDEENTASIGNSVDRTETNKHIRYLSDLHLEENRLSTKIKQLKYCDIQPNFISRVIKKEENFFKKITFDTFANAISRVKRSHLSELPQDLNLVNN